MRMGRDRKEKEDRDELTGAAKAVSKKLRLDRRGPKEIK